MRLNGVMVLGLLGLGLGCARDVNPRAAGSRVDVTAAGASPAARAATADLAETPDASPLQRVCADATCGGPGTVVQKWHDAQGALARWEIVHSPRCNHLAGLFYDREGKNPVLLPMPFFPPGKPSEQQALRSLHDAQIAALTAGERIACGR